MTFSTAIPEILRPKRITFGVDTHGCNAACAADCANSGTGALDTVFVDETERISECWHAICFGPEFSPDPPWAPRMVSDMGNVAPQHAFSAHLR